MVTTKMSPGMLKILSSGASAPVAPRQSRFE